jgi:hypothetical protein
VMLKRKSVADRGVRFDRARTRTPQPAERSA